MIGSVWKKIAKTPGIARRANWTCDHVAARNMKALGKIAEGKIAKMVYGIGYTNGDAKTRGEYMMTIKEIIFQNFGSITKIRTILGFLEKEEHLTIPLESQERSVLFKKMITLLEEEDNISEFVTLVAEVATLTARSFPERIFDIINLVELRIDAILGTVQLKEIWRIIEAIFVAYHTFEDKEGSEKTIQIIEKLVDNQIKFYLFFGIEDIVHVIKIQCIIAELAANQSNEPEGFFRIFDRLEKFKMMKQMQATKINLYKYMHYDPVIGAWLQIGSNKLKFKFSKSAEFTSSFNPRIFIPSHEIPMRLTNPELVKSFLAVHQETPELVPKELNKPIVNLFLTNFTNSFKMLDSMESVLFLDAFLKENNTDLYIKANALTELENMVNRVIEDGVVRVVIRDRIVDIIELIGGIVEAKGEITQNDQSVSLREILAGDSG